MLAAAGSPTVGEMDTADLVKTLERAFGVDVAKIGLPDGIDGAAWQTDGFRRSKRMEPERGRGGTVPNP
ncbi:hypothetical protein ABZ499_29305 [Streptomyces sp. NPDC019990]|uniref:hypothetical protein n=1 Tax=Streptomyces sp. NPDC019990 TaxID=3154693 RepID=UPI0033BFF9D4